MGKSEKKSKKHRSRSRERDERRRDKKPKKRRHRSSDESSSSSSPDSRRRKQPRRSESNSPDRRQHKHRARSKERRVTSPPRSKEMTKEEKRKQKMMMKALETPEEKRARRQEKKLAKERKRKEQMGWDKEMMGYTNQDNPFADPNLLETFCWHKKNAKLGLKDADANVIKKLSRHKQVENRLELQKVKQRRLEREKEREEREKEMELLQRQREAESFKEWEQQEDNFHLQQAKLRSSIRIKDGRAKPIDLLAQYIAEDDDGDFSLEIQEPYKILMGLTISDLEHLLADIDIYMKLDEKKNVDYWQDITLITEDELAKLKKIDPECQDGADRREGINNSVSSEIEVIFKGKTHSQLVLLQEQIISRLNGDDGAVDIGYWETLLQNLKAYIARARLKERHQTKLRNKLLMLRQQQGVESEPMFPAGVPGTSSKAGVSGSGEIELTDSDDEDDYDDKEEEPRGASGGMEEDQPGASNEAVDEEPEELITEEDLQQQSHDDYIDGRYSPVLLRTKELPPDTILFDPEEDMAKLEVLRKRLMTTGSAKETAESEFIKKARMGMGSDEATFAVEMDIQKQEPYLWSDKYRPRKPRFFNRVHTGFEWNKYNQTHYDMDNPPPKVVQGYKFNIFYPDLIDKRNAPEYTVTPCPDNEDFGVLRFNAGPPYEDIAFKIVNREWEYSHRHGFRCQFSNSIFQLWFRFKRYRYRR
ncbi:cactin-like [Anneissia japonica]|uniref:cactin-like n=1 Tax=Anneissia japonica TaxID=1529436 RepID=UPI00142566CE|nr:cactin-like [Anneissia japonica]